MSPAVQNLGAGGERRAILRAAMDFRIAVESASRVTMVQPNSRAWHASRTSLRRLADGAAPTTAAARRRAPPRAAADACPPQALCYHREYQGRAAQRNGAGLRPRGRMLGAPRSRSAETRHDAGGAGRLPPPPRRPAPSRGHFAWAAVRQWRPRGPCHPRQSPIRPPGPHGWRGTPEPRRACRHPRGRTSELGDRVLALPPS